MTVSGVGPEFYIPNALVLLGVLIAYAQLRRDRKKELENQTTRHQENISRLDSLKEFQAAQLTLNQMNSSKMNALEVQTATLTAILIGQNRRLEMLENRNR